MLLETCLTTVIGLLYAFYKWATRNNDYFAKRNLKFRKPYFLIGNNGFMFTKKNTAAGISQMLYNEFPEEA